MSLSSGTRLGPFEIRERLDLPGFGEVYAARDHETGGAVAIHVLRTNAAYDEEVREQFERDVRAAAARTQSGPLTIHLIGVDPQTIYVVSDLIDPSLAALAPVAPPRAADAVPQDARAPRWVWVAAAVVAISVLGVAMFIGGGGDEEVAEREAPQETTSAPPPAAQGPGEPAAPPERELLPPEQTEVRDYVVTESRPRPRPDAPAPQPRVAAPASPPPSAPAAAAPTAAPRERVPAAPRAPAPRTSAPASAAAPSASSAPPAPSAPRPSAARSESRGTTAPVPAPNDTRDTTTLITEATVHATEFDLDGALALLEVAARRGDAFARIAVLYLRGLVSARNAFREGGEPKALEPVQESLSALAEISKGRRGAAEIARLVLQAAAAAAQSERDEMRLYIESAVQMETLQLAAGLGGAPVVSAAELAGDFWLQVSRYEEARRAYTDAADRVGYTLRILSGLGRTARRLNDMPAACTAYRRLVDAWGARPGLPVEIAEARAYLGGCPR